MINNIQYLIRYIKSYKLDVLVVLCALMLVSVSLLAIGYGFRHLIDDGLKNDRQVLNQSILLICTLIFMFGFGSFLRSYFINNLTEKVSNDIRLDIIKNLLLLDTSNFEKMKLGEVISCLTSDLDLISKLITDFLSFFIRNALMCFGGLVLMFIQAPKLSIITIATILFMLFPLMKFGKKIRMLSKNNLSLKNNITSCITEIFANIKTVHIFNQEHNQLLKFNTSTREYLLHSSKRLKLRALFFASSISIVLLAITIVIWIGSMDIMIGKISSGKMISFIYFSIISGMSIGGIAEVFSESATPLAALDRVIHMLNAKDIINLPNINKGANLEKSKNLIKFHNVCFAYPNRYSVQVLKDLSFDINKGKVTAIVGRSGVGKSTIFQILLKFYPYQNGIITLDGKNLADITESNIRSTCAYVDQNPAIFSGSIRSNIAFSNPGATNELIESIAEQTGIMHFAKDLPLGLDTEIGERGVMLSGGQKQRIAIARAILYDKDILLLDEAMSALDNQSEIELLQIIRKIMNGKTIISIAHRISSIQHADAILVIDNGTVIAKGTHEKLLKSSELYSTLYSKSISNIND